MGYVGLSLAVLFARHHTVSVMDLAEEKVKLLSQGKSPVRDPYIESYLKNGGLDLTATTDEREAYEGAQFVVIAVPTNYDAEMNSFDTTAVEAVIRTVIRYNPDAVMVIKSTGAHRIYPACAHAVPDRQYSVQPGIPQRGKGALR